MSAVARPPSSWPFRGSAALRVLAALYLAGVWLDGTGTGIPARILPRAPNYFLQVAALFPRSAVASIDYRAEAFVCRERAWREIDTRPYFPIDRDDKENRFDRVMHFFRENRKTMNALDAYLVERHDAGEAEDGIQGRIGGVRFLSLRIPIPPPGSRLERTVRRPLSAYPDDERTFFYHTPSSRLRERCGLAGEDAR
ncbi:MAG TPA: hypothetical protein VGM06_01725 [Polyangiaceae bacterium]